MFERPQFSLKAILVIIAVLAVPLGMVVSGVPALVYLGGMSALPVLSGCIGYLVGGWRGLLIGMAAGALALISYAHFCAKYN